MNDSAWRAHGLSESKSHSQLLSSSNYDTLTSYHTKQALAINTNSNITIRYRDLRRDRLRSVSLSSHQPSTNISTVPCSPSSSSCPAPLSHLDTANAAHNTSTIQEENYNSNNDLISETEFLTVKSNLLHKLITLCKQSILRNLLSAADPHRANTATPRNCEVERQVARTLTDIIFENISEWECLSKVQRTLSALSKRYGKSTVINSLNITISIQHKSATFRGTLTSFLYQQVRECKSLLLIYDWHEMAKCIITFGGNIPTLLSSDTHALICMHVSRSNVTWEWNLCMKRQLFVHCMQRNMHALHLHRNDGSIPFILSPHDHKNHMECDLLLIHTLKYQMQRWNQSLFNTLHLQKATNYTYLIAAFCYDHQHLLDAFDYIDRHFLSSSFHTTRSTQHRRTIPQLTLSNATLTSRQLTHQRAHTLAVIYSLIRKKETRVSALRKLLCFAAHDPHIDTLINLVLKHHDILKTRLFAELIECHEFALLSSLLRHDIVLDSQCATHRASGLISLSLFSTFVCNNVRAHNSIVTDFVSYNASVCLYGVMNFCHNPHTNEIEIVNLRHPKLALEVIDDLLLLGLRPFATLSTNGSVVSVLYEALEIGLLSAQNGVNSNLCVHHYDLLMLFIVYFKFRKVKRQVSEVLLKSRMGVIALNADMCSIVNGYLWADEREIDSFFEWLFGKRMQLMVEHDCWMQWVLEYNILNIFSFSGTFNAAFHAKQIALLGMQPGVYWDWIYVLLVSNQKFVDYVLSDAALRRWLLNVMREIMKNLDKLKIGKARRRMCGFVKHHFETHEMLYVMNKGRKRKKDRFGVPRNHGMVFRALNPL